MENRIKSIELLNKAIASEIYTLNQYMYFHFHCDDRGYDLLAAHFKRTAIKEMTHVERLAERVLFLKGDVNMDVNLKIKHVDKIEQMYVLSLELEDVTIRDYNHWAKICNDNNDTGSKRLFESLVEEEEAHYDAFDVTLADLKNYGDNYLALQAVERSKTM